MSNTKIKVVVIGYGHIGKRHAAIIEASDFFELIAVVDPRPTNRQEAPSLTTRFFTSLEAFLSENLQAQLAVVATPNGLHSEQIARCLDSHLDVIAEKPMVLSSKELLVYHEKAISKGLHLFPVVQNRYAKISKWLQELLQKDMLGQIYIVQINCFWNRDERYYQKDSWHGDMQLDGGSLYTQFLHFIDMLYWLFGQPTIRHRELLDFNHQHLSHFEDSGIIQFGFNQGAAKNALATMTFSTAAWGQNAESALTIIAEKGSVKIGGQYMEKMLYATGQDLANQSALEAELSNDPYKEKHGAAAGHYRFWEELENFYKGAPAELPTVQEAAAVIAVIEQIYANRGNAAEKE